MRSEELKRATLTRTFSLADNAEHTLRYRALRLKESEGLGTSQVAWLKF